MRLLPIALVLLVATASAQEQPIVHITMTPEEVNVGEAADMQVTVLVPTWFARPPVYPSFEVANALVRLPPDSSYPISQRVGRDTWSGIVRNYKVYPLAASEYRLGGNVVKVSAANPGSDPLVSDVTVPEVSLKAIVPAGAEGLDPYIAGTSLMLTRDIDGDLDALEAGDAVVIRTIAELDGLPAMFLPPLSPEFAFDGVSIYADEPVVEDGDVARRTETVTLIFESGGEFVVPAIELEWWDTISNGIATAIVPEVPISVSGPTIEPVGDEAIPETSWRDLVTQILGLVVAALAGWRILHRLRIRAKKAAARHRESESYAFQQLAKACGSGDTKRTHHEMLAWLKRIAWHGNARSFARVYGNEKLLDSIDALSDHVYHDVGAVIDLVALLDGLKRARQNWRTDRNGGSLSALPPLNP
jgi:hypothetical protein